MEPGYKVLRDKVISLAGLDLDCYKSQQLERRLRALLTRTHASSLEQYASLLEREPERLRELYDLLTINVSEFFRNPERYSYLETRVIPSLPPSGAQVWSAGCANGAEPYSLAMIMKDKGLEQFSILATDIDLNVLDIARRGIYSQKDVATVPPDKRSRYFTLAEGSYRIADALKASVKFRKHNLLSDPYPNGFDLIVCRNVLIYFTESAKSRVASKFFTSLKPGGFLFVGSTETIFNTGEIGFVNVAPFFYQKPPDRKLQLGPGMP